MKTPHLNIIGISAYFHDSACALLRDGELVAAAEEERFTLVKHDRSLPVNAFRYCLEEAGVSISDIDGIAFYEVPAKKLSRQLWSAAPDLPLSTPEALYRFDANRPQREIIEKLGYAGRLEFVEHHLSHAAGSFYFSGFDESAILTVDGVGEWATMTYGRGRGKDIELFGEVLFPDSIGLLYSTITSYLGFEVNDAEYKVMGLAPYGKPTYAHKIRRLIQDLPDGQFRLRLEYFDFLRGGGDWMFSKALVKLFGEPRRVAESTINQFHKDVASSLQLVLEELMLSKATYLFQQAPSENLCMSGGVALNCVANGRVLRDGPFKRLFVQPAASDAGSALGAAAVAHVRMTGTRPSVREMRQVYLGPSYAGDHIESLLDAAAIAATDFRGRTDELIAHTARLLADGKVVGWFQGRMEFGPRALGGRSILADPRDPSMRDKINAQVKKREGFRPFAPAVLEERAREHFALDQPSRFMLATCQVRSPLSLPAVTHVDGSARVQTVTDEDNALFARLLREFDRLTGCPILLNTSFNLRGEPMVLTPWDAFACYVRSDIDHLVLGDFVVDRSAITASIQELGERYDVDLKDRRRAAVHVSEKAYAFV